MLSKVKNNGNINGKLHSFGRFPIEKKDADTFKGGSFNVLVSSGTDQEVVVEVKFFPQSRVFKNKKENSNFEFLEKLMNAKTITQDGINAADSVRLTTQISSNQYYKEEGSDWRLVEFAENTMAFGHLDSAAKPIAAFEVDALVTAFDEEIFGDAPTGRYVLKGQVFNDYRKVFMPVSFIVEGADKINYIASNYTPGEAYVTLHGEITSRTFESNSSQETVGFGEVAIERTSSRREYLITGGTPPREMDMTDEDMAQVKANRELLLSEAKNYAIERKGKQKNGSVISGTKTTTASAKKTGGFEF